MTPHALICTTGVPFWRTCYQLVFIIVVLCSCAIGLCTCTCATPGVDPVVIHCMCASYSRPELKQLGGGGGGLCDAGALMDACDAFRSWKNLESGG